MALVSWFAPESKRILDGKSSAVTRSVLCAEQMLAIEADLERAATELDAQRVPFA